MSTFINKAGSVHAPNAKIVRRRPPAAAKRNKPTEIPTSAIQDEETQRQTTPQLPTPNATQEPVQLVAPQAKQSVFQAEPTPTPAPTSVEATPAARAPTPPPTTEVSALPPARIGSGLADPLSHHDAYCPTPVQPQPSRTNSPAPQQPVVVTSEPNITRDDATNEWVPAPAPTPESTDPAWAAVNATQSSSATPAKVVKPRRASGRRKRKAVTLQNMDEEDSDDGVEAAPFAPRKPSARARGKRKAAEPVADVTMEATAEPTTGGAAEGTAEGATGGTSAIAPPPAKRRRTVKKPQAQNASSTERTRDVENAEPAPRPKRKRTKKQTAPQPGQPEGGVEGDTEGAQPARRRGRAPTPEDAEGQTIDPNNTLMNSLASRNFRIGKLSQRERKMREINWDDVKKRQREREEEQLNTRAARAEVDRQLTEAELAAREAAERAAAPQLTLVDGEMRIVQGSGTIDQSGDAGRDFEMMETVEEDDFTNRINYRSFLRNNKRYPEEFLLPGQGKRWNFKDTEDFYEALAMFGTDFGLMATVFKDVSRRSIKLKFNREERKNPERIDQILRSRTRINWDEYLAASGSKDEAFVNVEETNAQLQALEGEYMQQIEEVKAQAEEERRQRRLAGVEVDGDGGNNENGDGENANRKKRSRKGKERQVTFQDDNVEVLEVFDDDQGREREMTWSF